MPCSVPPALPLSGVGAPQLRNADRIQRAGGDAKAAGPRGAAATAVPPQPRWRAARGRGRRTKGRPSSVPAAPSHRPKPPALSAGTRRPPQGQRCHARISAASRGHRRFASKRNDDGAGAPQPRTCRPRGIGPPPPDASGSRGGSVPAVPAVPSVPLSPCPHGGGQQPAAPRCPSAPRRGGGRSPSRRGPARCRCRRPYLCPWAAGRCAQPLSTGMRPAPVGMPLPVPLPMPMPVRAVSAPPLRSRPAPPHPRAPIGRRRPGR